MKLSIVTINLNNREGLRRTIESVVGQTYRDFEWVVIDGGSTDGSKELIESYAEHFAYHVSEPDKGIYNAMNKGIKASSGDYLLFLNSGDYLADKDVLEKVIPLLQDKDMYVGYLQIGGNIQKPQVSSDESLLNTLETGFFPHQASFIHRRVFSHYGLYREDKKIVSDWWLFYRSIVLGHATVAKLPFVISVFQGGGISSRFRDAIEKELYELREEISPRFLCLDKFYRENIEIVEALRGTKWGFFLFRIYFFIYRRFYKHKR